MSGCGPHDWTCRSLGLLVLLIPLRINQHLSILAQFDLVPTARTELYMELSSLPVHCWMALELGTQNPQQSLRETPNHQPEPASHRPVSLHGHTAGFRFRYRTRIRLWSLRDPGHTCRTRVSDSKTLGYGEECRTVKDFTSELRSGCHVPDTEVLETEGLPPLGPHPDS